MRKLGRITWILAASDGHRQWFRKDYPMRLYRCITVLVLLSFASVLAVGAQTEPWSVEDVITPSDVVVLGRVTATDPEGVVLAHRVFTRHTFQVGYSRATRSR